VNYADLIGILPILVLVLASAVVMVVAAFHRSHILAAGLSLAAFLVAIVALLGMAYKSPRAVTLLFIVDDYALFFRSSTSSSSWQRWALRCWSSAATLCPSSSGWRS
jgi:NADH:ubiquinone oxidoreductase subunit 2 (subunit N)